MLQLMRQRREDKEDKKRLEREGGSALAGSQRKTGLGLIEKEGDIAEIVYKKRGAVREWDLGKE